jgi:hypothetical protein
MKARLLLILSLMVTICMAAAVHADVVLVEDDFDDDHTYFDGTEIDVDGTQWDGLYGTQWLASCSANTPTSSWLAYDLPPVEDTSIVNLDNYPHLYKEVTGPFVAEMKIGGTISVEAWVVTFMLVADHAGNYSGGGAFGAINSSQAVRMQNGTRNIDLNTGTLPAQWYRMERIGALINLYRRETDTSTWEFIHTHVNDTLPETAMVGPIVATHTADLNGIYFYDYFKITSVTGTYGLVQADPEEISKSLTFGETASDSFVLTNMGTASATWNLANKQPWYTLTPDNGVIPPGGMQQVQVDVTAALPKGNTTINLEINNDGLAQVLVELSVSVLPEGGEITILDDHFDDDHTYWDGTEVDVDGTDWDGLHGTEYLSLVEANNPSDSFLAVSISLDTDVTSIGGTDYRFPFLYKDVTGDFIAEFGIGTLIPEAYVTELMGCIDLTQSNDYMCGAFPMAPVWGFFDYDAAHEAGNRVLDRGNGPYVTSNKYYRLVRSGDSYAAYSRYSPDSNWFEFATYTPAVDHPDTMSVGMLVAEHGAGLGYTYYYDYFKITQVGAAPGQFMVLPTNIVVDVNESSTPVQVSTPVEVTVNIEVTSGASFLSAPSSVTVTDEVRVVELTLTSPTIDDVGTVTFTNVEGTPEPQVVTVTVVPEPATWCMLTSLAALLIRRR